MPLIARSERAESGQFETQYDINIERGDGTKVTYDAREVYPLYLTLQEYLRRLDFPGNAEGTGRRVNLLRLVAAIESMIWDVRADAIQDRQSYRQLFSHYLAVDWQIDNAVIDFVYGDNEQPHGWLVILSSGAAAIKDKLPTWFMGYPVQYMI